MQKIIVITDNADGTQSVVMHNVMKEGHEVRINRAEISFGKTEAQTCVFNRSAHFQLDISCLVDSEGVLYKLYDPAKDMSALSTQELFTELNKRKAIVKETIYKVL